MASASMKGKEKYLVAGSAFGALSAGGAAGLAGLCCAGPAVVALLGVSGTVLAADIAPYRPYFLVGSVALLGFGFWRTYRPVKLGSGACCPVATGRAVRAVLWGSLAVTLASVLVPFLSV